MKIYQVGIVFQEGDAHPYKTFANKEKAESFKLKLENKKKIEEDFVKGCETCQLVFMNDSFKYQNNVKKLEQIASKMTQRSHSAIINVDNGTKGWHMCDNDKSTDIDFCGYYFTEIEVEE